MKMYQPGEVIGSRYVVHSLLGEGGLGLVYLCQLAETGQFCAIKVIKADSEVEMGPIGESIKREAMILSGLRHKNIVRLYEYMEERQWPMFVMEYINGYTIADPALHGPYAYDSFINCAMQCMEGLAAAHRNGLLHLDIKPENIMVIFDKEGRTLVKILDFGISQMVAEIQDMSNFDEIVGSVYYVAPEQLRRKTPTAAADLYALGHVFYLMLAGQVAYPIEDAEELVRRKISEDAPDIRHYRQDLPEEFVHWLHRLISRNPKDRPQTCQQALKELTFLSIRNSRPPDPPSKKDQPKSIGRRISQSLKDLLSEMNLDK